MTDTRTVVQEFLTRRASGDIDAIVALFADEVDFRTFGSPRVPWLSNPTTREAVRAFFEALWKGVTPIDASLDAMIVDGEEAMVVGQVQVTVNATGNVYDSPFALRLTVRDGQIIRHQVFEDSYALHVAITQ